MLDYPQIGNTKVRFFIYWGLPVLLSLLVYLMLFISSNFEDEIYSFGVLIYFIINGLLVAFATNKVLTYKSKNEALNSKFHHFLLALVVGIFFYLLLYIVVKNALIIITNQDDSIDFRHIILAVVQGGILSIIIAGAQYLYLIVNAKTQAQLNAERLEKENMIGRFSVLKLQLSPHFLFNNFNTLDGLIGEDPKQAQVFLHELSLLFRSILKHNKEDLITLREEIDLVNHFIFLIKKRFGENYQCEINLNDEILDQYFLPPMSIQLLLENSIKHNEISKEAILKNSVKIVNKRLVVINNLNPKGFQHNSSQIGLDNLRKRYQYFTKEKVMVVHEGESFMVSLPLLEIDHLQKEQSAYA